MENIKLIVGLGNIGKKYEHTRHNIGFDVIEILQKKLNIQKVENNFKGTYFQYENSIFFRPSTFMNLSGIAVKEIVDFYKINYDDILVIMDDMSLTVGQIRLRDHGSSGGHKGLQNIIDNLNSNLIKRIRIGIGKPINKEEINDFVLGKPNNEDKEKINNSINIVANIVLNYAKHTFLFVLNNFNKLLNQK